MRCDAALLERDSEEIRLSDVAIGIQVSFWLLTAKGDRSLDRIVREASKCLDSGYRGDPITRAYVRGLLGNPEEPFKSTGRLRAVSSYLGVWEKIEPLSRLV